jgi:hypothetical protein
VTQGMSSCCNNVATAMIEVFVVSVHCFRCNLSGRYWRYRKALVTWMFFRGRLLRRPIRYGKR